MANKTVVGLGGLLSDPACVVIREGELAAAVEQAKLSRHDRPGAFPDEAFSTALASAGVEANQIGCVAIARPFATNDEASFLLDLRARFPQSEVVVADHHGAHAASAFYLSGFEEASVLSIDRAGDFRSAVLYRGRGTRLERVRELYFPDSLGDLYNRLTELLGFEARADEHKVQWLSVGGEPVYADVFRAIVNARNGWPKFERSYFDSDRLREGAFSSHFFKAIGIDSQAPLTAKQKADLASSLQFVIEETVAAMLGETENVALAGGLALNALLVRSLEQRFHNVFVQPVAGNAGTSLGAALYAWHSRLGESARVPFSTLCLGPEFTAPDIKRVLENCKLRFRYLLTAQDLIAEAIRALRENKIVAWMQGRMEFGPRALGNRSILASPLDPYSTENLNVYIKHREKFRKFAASVPEEVADEYFRVGPNGRFLATVGKVRPEHRERFSAAILSGDLIRVHVVRRDENPLYHSLLTAMGNECGLPVLYNTSFNLFGDPLVCTPRDAVRSFYSSGIDALFAGNFYLEK
ncbi:MAG TPA: carbamoyltransferase C-terminal domain-containing protein [Bryobacteraceae bacterium]|jgi:carbamoyltransferase|nr:carbamoyltransferase C-terminal domain-containing protein [Bryobacteraceae bacterium]